MGTENNLHNKAIENLNILCKLDKEDVIKATRMKISKTDSEFVQVDNVCELESSIYFTFHQLFMTSRKNEMNKKRLLKKLHYAVESIYDNTHLQEIIKQDSDFSEMMDDIESILFYIWNKNCIDSPLYNLVNFFETCETTLNRIFKEACKYACFIDVIPESDQPIGSEEVIEESISGSSDKESSDKESSDEESSGDLIQEVSDNVDKEE